MLAALVIVVVSLALVVGAVWGVFGISTRTEGFVVSLAGGALMVSAVLELIDPAADVAPLWAVATAVLSGAGVFVLLARWVARRLGRDSGGGLLAAVTLDGVPENLALGVVLISAGPKEAAALAGSILLSNLPEAAGGARDMVHDHSRRLVLGVWTGTAVLLSGAALLGHVALAGVDESVLALVEAFAGGAVVGSLATTVFPDAFDEDSFATGVATALGLLLALGLDRLG
ncbi:hypothetical protein [Nocardioides aestuarii]|uniref:ZIP family metal transporter n=1 Tax=Nocardioides aestuarii TaxID=252231 RepID=A0ABW4TND3_9ACTN